MTKWVPSLDFDEQQLEIQPDCDITFAYYGRNIISVPTLKHDGNDDDYQQPLNEAMLKNHEFQMIQQIKSTMYGDSLIGRRLNTEEVEDPTTRELETISMIRKAGMGPSVDEGLNSKRTIPAIESDKPHTRRHFPVLYNENYFKLRPRKKSSKNSSKDSSSSMDSSLSKNEPDPTNSCTVDDGQNRENIEKIVQQIDSLEIRSSPTVKAVFSPKELESSHVTSPCNISSDTESARRSPLPVPRDNANTPVLQISQANDQKKYRKPKIAANFAALAEKCNNNKLTNVDPDRIRKLRACINFVTPNEVYRLRRQLKEKRLAAQ